MAHDRERRRFVLSAVAAAGIGAARATPGIAATRRGRAALLWPT